VTGLLFALVYFAVTGIAATTWGERYVLGTAIAGITLFLFGVLHLPLVAAAIVAPSVALIGGLLLRRRHEREQLRYPRVATLVMLLPVAIVFVSVLLVPLNDFDGRVFWMKKAKAIAHERAVDGPYFRGEVMENPRIRYPLLVPLDAALVFMATRDADDRQTRGMFALLFLALLLVVRRGIARQFGAEAGAWCSAILAWLPPFLASDGGVLSAYADIPMAAFVACAFFALADRDTPFRLGIWLSALALTKNEGLPLALLLLLPAIAIHRRRIGATLVPLLASIAALFVWHSRLPPTDVDDLFSRLSLLPQRIERIGPAVARIATHMATFSVWGLFWIAVAVCCVVAAKRRLFLPLYLLGGMLAIYVVTYVVHTWPLANIVDSSIDRLLMHLIAPALFVLANALRVPARPPATFRART
jgi:hypothetical protein